jgi:hypothetical protein
MRIYVTLLWLTLVSCEKQNVYPEIVGTWDWVFSKGGIAGLTIKPTALDNRQMIFDAGANYTFKKNGTVLVSTKYKLENAKSIASNEPVPSITFPSNDAMTFSYSIKGDSLFLFEEVYDGFGHTYVRK